MTPHVTDHAADQWDERTDPRSVAPETAWAHAQRHDGASISLHGPDEVRYHCPTRTLLLRVGHAIVTVYPETFLDEPARRVVADGSTTECTEAAEP